MLDTQDIQVLREMFGGMLAENNEILRSEIGMLRSEMIGEFKNVRGQMHTMKEEIFVTMHKEFRSVRDDIIEVINDGVLPQIERLNVRVTRLERMQRQASY